MNSNSTPNCLQLLLRDDCALCDEAWEVLAEADAGDFESVYIEQHPELLARYSEYVPVLRMNVHELPWPFTAIQVRDWMQCYTTQ
jgi:hypothetical protein